MGRAYPVGVGQIYADGSGGVCVAGEDGCGDYFCGDSFYFVLAEARVDRRIVFKPLCVAADGFRALRCGYVLEVYD